MDRVVLWDFDGTLAYRPGMWAGAIVEALAHHVPGHGVDEEQVRPLIRDRFPWHRPQKPHPHLSEPEAWWRHVGGLLNTTMRQLGFDGETSARLAEAARRRYVDPSSFRLFDDARPALERLGAGGWRHIVLSNHVPELESIVDGVGLGDLVETVLSSARTGYEKPHPEAFALARRAAGNPAHLWMVGDNPDADVLGAESAGIPAILVHTEDTRVARQAPDLTSVASLLEKASVGA